MAALAALRDDQIDTSDIPELPPSVWKDAIRGKFYRPEKQGRVTTLSGRRSE